jgi:hypothetical protein
MRISRLLGPAFVFLVALTMPLRAVAQDASPAAGAAGQMACTAEPRDIDEMLALWFNAEGTPAATPTMAEPVSDAAALPQGSAPDQATLDAITATTQGFIECLVVEGQYARGFSYFTDHALSQLGPDVTNPEQDTPEKVRAALENQLAGTPIAGEEGMGQMPPVTGPVDARMLPDGRAGAIWSLQGDAIFLVYKQQDNRWLIDDVVDIIEGESTP